MNATHRTFVAPLLLAAALVLSLVWGSRFASAEPEKRPDAPTGTINLNTATEDELQLLPGVGPAKAAAIVAWRKKHGSFKKVDDLTRVRGFGRKTLQRLKPFLSVGGSTTLRAKQEREREPVVGRPPAEEMP